MNSKEVRNYAALFLVLLLLILSYYIFKPYLGSVLLSIVLALVFYPVYKSLLKYLKISSFAAIATVVIAIVAIILPIAILGFFIGREVVALYNSGFIDSLNQFVSSLLSQNAVTSRLVSSTMDNLVSYASQAASSLLLNLPSEFFQLIVVIFTTFSLLITGSNLAENIKRILPFKNKEELIKTIKDNLSGIVYGFVIIALIDFVVAVIGLYFLGIPHYMLWSIIVAFTVLIPFMGPLLFWLPYSIFLFVRGDVETGIGMVVLGLLLSGIETFGRPYLIGKRVNIHPVAIMIGVLGGLPIFGIVGVIIGPVVLSLTFILVEEIMRDEVKG